MLVVPSTPVTTLYIVTTTKQNGGTSTLNDEAMKLVDHFTYLSSNISSRGSDINIRLGNARTAYDRLLIIWKSDLQDRMKRDPSKL